MKVVHVITRMILGGAQENTLLSCEDQHTLLGNDVTLITGPTTGPEGTLMPRAEASGIRIIEVPSMIRSVRPLKDWAAYHELKKHFKRLQPDVVHTHTSKAGIIGRKAAYDLGIPVVHTIHGASFHFGQSALAYRTYVWLEKLAAKWTDHFISVADEMTAEYVRAGVAKPENFTTIYSGFDVEPFLNPPRPRDEVRAEFGFKKRDIVVGKIGRLFTLKGHEFILKAAPDAIRANPHIKFLFVGDGILRDKFEQEIREKGLTDHFVFSGLVPTTRIPELMSAMDIVAHTSEWEGLARVLPQGLIAGKPVISYDVGGAREVVRNGETGYLLKRGDIHPLVAAIVELANNPGLREKFGNRGRELFQNQFRHQTMAAEIDQVYKKIRR